MNFRTQWDFFEIDMLSTTMPKSPEIKIECNKIENTLIVLFTFVKEPFIINWKQINCLFIINNSSEFLFNNWVFPTLYVN